MKKNKVFITLSSLAILFCSCVTKPNNEVDEKMINEVKAPELPVLMVCPAPGQDYDSFFTKADSISETEGNSFLIINTNEKDAKVYLNSQEIGNTNIKITDLPSGSYILDVTKEGFEDLNKMISVNDNKGYEYTFELTKSEQ